MRVRLNGFLGKHLLLIGSGLWGGLGYGAEDGVRSWTATDGRTLDAKITYVGGGMVRMARSDGREFDIPIERFVEKDRRLILSWTPPEIEVGSTDETVLVIESKDGRGSGFLVQDGGVVWVYTNQHVIGDGSELKASNSRGEVIALGDLQIASDRDLARFATNETKGLKMASSGTSGDEVVVFGNSQGSGVITRSEGRILGVSPETFEVSSEIVSGNSGGPVLNEEGEVLGVSSFVQLASSYGDPTMRNTRYEKPRRFALRLDGEIDFRSVTRSEFREVFDSYQEGVKVFDESLTFTRMIVNDPGERLMVGSFDSPEVAKLAESHNKDLGKVPDYVRSQSALRSQVRRFYGRYMDNLEDSYEIAEDSLEPVLFTIRDPRFGWILSEVEKRQEILANWKEAIERIEASLD